MISSAPAKILIGITLNPDDSKELLSWAITTLAHPNDTVVALHILGDHRKKHESIGNNRTRHRRTKAFVISVMGEFSRICQDKQVNMEARVGFSSSVGKGLIEETKNLSAEFLIVGRQINQSDGFSRKITRYCFQHAPQGCTVVSVGKCVLPQRNPDSKSQKTDGHGHEVSFRWVDHLILETKGERPSPRRVLDICDVESSNGTEEDSSSFGGSSITESPPLSIDSKKKSNCGRPPSPFKLISSFLRSSFDLHGKRRNEIVTHKDKQQRPLLRCVSYEEIAKATNNFHPDNVVGRGGYSEVYKGYLDDGQIVAVKKLAKDNANQNKEKEFLMELGIIGHVNHPNTALLVGCCIENGLHLIFNFSPNGTLASALHGKTENVLGWQHRYKIAVGVARGLHYLHKCCKHRIIHRDIKASNVLLGLDCEPQIADFGLAKWLPNKWSHHAVIPIEGTFGYLAPEYFMHGIVDEKIDVFSYGILLLEIITGRRPVDSSKQNLLLWAKPLMESGKITELVDPRLKGNYDLDQMHTTLLTSSYCVRQSSTCRPSMTEVLELLMHGDDPEAERSWRMPRFTSEEMDDYSMAFGYGLPSDISLDDL